MNALSEYRCPKCNKLLFTASISSGVIEDKCERCNEVRRFEIGTSKPPMIASDWHGMTRTVSNSETHVYQDKQKQLVTR